VQNVIELATPDVALHLLVPFVIPPAVQPRRQLGALLKRQLLNGALDFGEAHGPEFPRKKRSRNNRKPGAVSGIRTILAPTSFS
jgi:hypothetical protein